MNSRCLISVPHLTAVIGGTAITLFVTMVVVNRLGIAIAKSRKHESGQLEGAAGDVNS